jgi:capsular exopolysaccharide synthesis family protein
MGKVFDALNRTELERDDESMDAIDEFAEAAGAQSSNDRFSFFKYSIGASSAGDRHRERQQAASAAIVRRSQAEPGFELTLDPARVDPHLISFYNSNPQATERYNKLALSLISRAAERGFKRVLVASAQQGEGRTTVTLNLAAALARARQRVLVVDCDFMNPGIARALGINCEIGLADAFERGLPSGAATTRIRPYGFHVVANRRRIQNSVELMAAPGFWKMLQTFDEHYDFILFDSSPLLCFGDSSLLVRFTDTTLLVVQAGRVDSGELTKAMSPFTQDDILGVVMNRAAE